MAAFLMAWGMVLMTVSTSLSEASTTSRRSIGSAGGLELCK
jgi:hypothetical protein